MKNRSNIQILLVMFATVFLLNGCSTISYVEPTTGELARIRFATNTKGITVVRGYKTTDCQGEEEWMRLRNGPLANSSPKALGIPLWDYNNNAAKEFYFSTEKPLILMFSGSGYGSFSTYSCGVPVVYKIEKGKDYELSFEMNQVECTASMFEIVKSKEDNYKKKLIKKFNKIDSYSDGGLASMFGGAGILIQEMSKDNSSEEACIQAFRKTRLY